MSRSAATHTACAQPTSSVPRARHGTARLGSARGAIEWKASSQQLPAPQAPSAVREDDIGQLSGKAVAAPGSPTGRVSRQGSAPDSPQRRIAPHASHILARPTLCQASGPTAGLGAAGHTEGQGQPGAARGRGLDAGSPRFTRGWLERLWASTALFRTGNGSGRAHPGPVPGWAWPMGDP